METFSALLAICAGNSPVTGEFPAQRPVTGSFDVFFGLHHNKRLSKQSWGWWFGTPSHPLWHHCNVIWTLYSKETLKNMGIYNVQSKTNQCAYLTGWVYTAAFKTTGSQCFEWADCLSATGDWQSVSQNWYLHRRDPRLLRQIRWCHLTIEVLRFKQALSNKRSGFCGGFFFFQILVDKRFFIWNPRL